jgi:hypothetical protein
MLRLLALTLLLLPSLAHAVAIPDGGLEHGMDGGPSSTCRDDECQRDESAVEVPSDAALLQHGEKPEDFVPKGWRLDSQTEGNLTGGKKPDLLLSLTIEGPTRRELDAQSSGSNITQSPPWPVLNIVLCAAAHGYDRCATHTGWNTDKSWDSLSIEKEQLHLRKHEGMGHSSSSTLEKFRWNARACRFQLIGVERDDEWGQGTMGCLQRSENWLTHEALQREGEVDPESGCANPWQKEKLTGERWLDEPRP